MSDESKRAIAAAKEVQADLPADVLALYELGEREPRAWVNSSGRLIPEGKHPRILFGAVPIHLHLTCGISVAPLSDRDGATEDGRTTGPPRLYADDE